MTATQVRRLFDRADEQIQEAMQPYGYYDVSVESDLAQGEKVDEYVATFEVDLGDPVVVREANVENLRATMRSFGVEPEAATPAEFWEIARFPAGAPRQLAIAFNRLYFSLGLPASLSTGITLIGRKK